MTLCLTTVLIGVPIIGALIVWLTPLPGQWVASLATLVALVEVGLWIVALERFDFSSPSLQLAQRHAWFSDIGSSYHVGLYGYSLWLVGLTVVGGAAASMYAWWAGRDRPRGVRRLLSLANRKQIKRMLYRMLDETEFLSDYGIRAISRIHREKPFMLEANGMSHRVDYEPAESSTGLFGGNSNWRGPIWFPINFLLVESLQKFHHFLGDGCQVELPTGSGQKKSLWDVSANISRRLSQIFLRDGAGRRPVFGQTEKFQSDPQWRDYVPFHEYFHGDTGAGVGASHQTGWTGLVAKLIEQSGE